VFPFTVPGPRRSRYGLGALKGVGQSAVEAIVGEREARGPFKSMIDLCRRVDLQKINRRVLEALVRSGALDALGPNRATLNDAVPDVLQLAERSAHASAAGQGALFGGDESQGTLKHELVTRREWTKRERLQAEYESLGLHLTGHAFDSFADHRDRLNISSIAKIVGGMPSESANFFATRKEVTLAGAVMDIRRRPNRTTLVLDDDTERIEVTLFDETFAQFKHVISKHAVLIVEGQLRYDDFLNGWRVTAKRVRSADELIEEQARRLTIPWSGTLGSFVRDLQRTLKPFTHGGCEVCVDYRSAAGEAQLTLGEAWSVRLTRELRDQLVQLLGENKFAIHYRRHIV
jgi:DNA polymerase-3 subunit alpha